LVVRNYFSLDLNSVEMISVSTA